MENMTDRHATSIKRVNSNYVQPQCGCGWRGHLTPIQTVEGWALAERDVKDHLFRETRRG